jgi:4-hydroxy-tetrahydrodipicolinate synthase
MSQKLNIGPINAATPTPLNADGEIDAASVKKLARRWINLKLDGVMVLGSMGEGYILSDATRNAFVEQSLAAAGDKLTLFASAADYSRQRTKERALRYAKMGAHCIVLCLPVNVPAAKAVADVKAVADACPIPCAYYDIPANTGTALVLEEILSILAHENIVAMKDSSINPTRWQALTSSEYRPRVKLLNGTEYGSAYSVMLGYDGWLHGGGVLTGKRLRQILEAVRAGKIDEAMKLDREASLCLAMIYNRLSRPLQNVAGQKHALKLLGAMDSDFTLEQTLDDASRVRIAAAVEKNRSWLAT